MDFLPDVMMGGERMSILHVGVDIAKDDFAVAVWTDGRSKPMGTVANDEAGFAQLAEQLKQLCQEQGVSGIRLIMEATGGYELRLAYFAHAQGWEISVANAKQVRDWANGSGRRAKTDKLDAQWLARYGVERQPALWRPLPEAASELESLVTRKRELEKMLRQELNRQHSLQQQPKVAQVVPENVKLMIEAIKKSIEDIEQAIDELLRRHPPMQEDVKALDGVPGIGEKTVLPIFALLARWDNLTQGQGTGKQLTAYVGLDPKTRESGKSVRGRAMISKMGDPDMRRALFMAALGGIRGNNALHDFYKRLVGRGKAKMVALVAAARKILLWAWEVYRNHTNFDPKRLAGASAK